MSQSDKQPPRAAKDDRVRKRAPVLSVFIAGGLIVACGIIIGTRHHRKDTNDPQPPTTEPTEFAGEKDPEEVTETPPLVYVETTPVATDSSLGPKVGAVKVKGVYIDAWTAGDTDEIEWLIDICNTSEINAVVIDVKEDNGYITYFSENERLESICIGVISDISLLMSIFKENNIYTIARLVCFKDPVRANMSPELAISGKNGAIWTDQGGVAWLDPYNFLAWEYLATVAKDAAGVGFDEIQLDYVRFPADGNLGQIDYGSEAEEKSKAEVIIEFIEFMKSELEETRARLSADVFGIIAVGKGDFEGIGQDLDLMWEPLDSVCPMIYPSHFANARQNGIGQVINGVLFERPDLDPYGVVYNILLMTKDRLPDDEADHAAVRPYLQAFTASYLGSGYYQSYGAKQVLEQINAVYDAGFEEWILWNHSGRYDIYSDLGELLPLERISES